MKKISIRNMKYDNMINMNKTIYEELKSQEKTSGFIFTFEKLKWIDPSGAVLFLETIAHLNKIKVQLEFEKLNTSLSAVSYGLNMGIFQELGLTDYKSKDEGDTYLAPKKIKREEVTAYLNDTNENIESYYEYISSKIANKILGSHVHNFNEKIYRLFTYVIRELIRNIFDHSESDYFYYGSQFIPSTSVVELVISDGGVGLKHTIPFDAEERWFNNDTTENAIKKAFMPGITAESNHSYATENYLNSGFGLAMVKQIILLANGILSLGTSDKTISFTNDREILNECQIQGTIIRIRIDLEKLISVDFENVLKSVYEEAQLIDKSFKPSRRSQTL